MAAIEQRKGRDGKWAFRAKVRLKGYPPQSATFARTTDAKRWAQATEAAIREGRYFKVAESRRRTLSELVERYKSEVLAQKSNGDNHRAAQLDWWKRELGHVFLSDLSPSVIASAREKLSKTPIARSGALRSPSTVVRYLAALSHALTVASREWEWLDANPVARVSKPKESRGRTRFLSDAERYALLDACHRHSTKALYPIVVIAVSTGMRRSEILGLRWEDVDLTKGKAILWQTKNGERRVVSIPTFALSCLKAWATVRRIDTSLVFPGTKTGPNARPLSFEKAWRSAVRAAGLTNFRFHDLRHSTASYLAMNGASLSEIAEVLGHKTLQMVKRYAHLSEAHTATVIESLNRRLFAAANSAAIQA